MGWPTKYTGAQIDAALEKGQSLRVVNNGWIRLESSSTSPTDLDSLKNPGNYTTSFWINGPDFKDETITPINISITSINGDIYQFIEAGGKSYVRIMTREESIYGIWNINQTDGAINPGPTAPTAAVDGKTIWLDTSNLDTPTLKLFINGEWKIVIPEGSMLTSVYDPQGKQTDIFKYIDDSIKTITEGSIPDMDAHLDDTDIHVTSEEKSNWNNAATTIDVDTAANNLESSLTTKVTNLVNSEVNKINELSEKASTLQTSVDTHTENSTIHPTTDQQVIWDKKAEGNHTHHKDGNVTVTPSDIDGIIPSNQLPYDVKERVYVINNEEELYSISKNPVHNGDLFCIESESKNTWYFVVNDDYLGNQEIDGWEESAINTTNTNRYWQSICYGNGKFVAISSSDSEGISKIAYSYDGIDWIEKDLSGTISTQWKSICYGNGKFVAVGNDNMYCYSTDGINWNYETISSTEPDKEWVGVCYGDGMFVAIAKNSDTFSYSNLMDTNEHGYFIWNDITLWEGFNANWTSIAYGNHGFYAIAGTEHTSFYFNLDGTYKEMPDMPTHVVGDEDLTRNYVSICYGNGVFVAVATESNVIATYVRVEDRYDTWVENPIYFNQTEIIPNQNWNSVCYGNGKFVAVANYSNLIATSVDGINWTIASMGTEETIRDWQSVCYGNGKFVAIAHGSNRVTNSTMLPLAAKAFKKFAVSDLSWEGITNTPTTLAGYGITDAATKAEYSIIKNEVAEINATMPSEVELSTTVETHALYTNAVNDLNTLDSAFTAMDNLIAKIETISQ